MRILTGVVAAVLLVVTGVSATTPSAEPTARAPSPGGPAPAPSPVDGSARSDAAADMPPPAAATRGSMPALPRRAVQPGPVFVVGDSLTVGAEPWLDDVLRSKGWRVTGVDARVGRGVGEGLDVLRSQGRALPATVLIALGTNNLRATPSEVAGWLRDARRIAGARRIVWVGLCLDDVLVPRLSTFRAMNRALSAAAPRFDVEVADWCGYAAARGIRTTYDGIHYDDYAYEWRAWFYGQALDGRLSQPPVTDARPTSRSR